MNRFEYADAGTVQEAVELTVNGSAFKAGGVDLVDLMKERIAQPSRVINLLSIPGLNEIKSDNKGITIGPLVTLTQLDEHPLVNQRYTALAQAAREAATPHIRNVATVGGNLLQRPRCWYFRSDEFHCKKKGGDHCFAQDGENQYHAIFDNHVCAIVHPSAAATALVAMGATLELSAGKTKREVKLEEFLTPPTVDVHRENAIKDGELVTAIKIPAMPMAMNSHYIKQKEKESFDWPIAEVAAVILRDRAEKCLSASIVLGAAAPVPHRAREAEEYLTGKEITRDSALAAADAAMRRATPLALNRYKVPLLRNLIARTILAAAANA